MTQLPPPLPGQGALADALEIDPPTNPGTRREERREARMERRPGRKGYVPLARKGGVRRESTWLYVALVAVWWPAMWKLGMPLDWAGTGLAAAAAALLGLQVGDTVRPTGAAKAEEA